MAEWVQSTFEAGLAATATIRSQLPHAQPVVLYALFLGWLSFFYTPFRDASLRERNDDRYARLVRMLHAWSTVHVVLFHVLPAYMDYMHHAGATSSSGIVFIVLFSTFSMAFQAWHWSKRRIGLTVTYGATPLHSATNAAILAMILTVQHLACAVFTDSGVTSDSEQMEATIVTGLVCPRMYGTYHAMVQLVGIGFIAIVADYRYKVWWGSDPVRGFFTGARFGSRDRVKTEMEKAQSAMRFNVSGDCTRSADETAPGGNDMVSWYSLLAAEAGLKAFVRSAISFGRFDYRTMEPEQGPKTWRVVDSRPGSADVWKRDGFWFDWVADVGDGFNSTYAIAHAMAQPALWVGTKPISRAERARRIAQNFANRTWKMLKRSPQSVSEFVGKFSTGSSADLKANAQPKAHPQDLGTSDSTLPPPSQDLLPRGALTVIGGDLCYPMPTMDGFFERFFQVYNDAMPFDGTLQLPSKRAHSVSSKGDEAEVDTNPELRPAMFVMPGNHDWFDGLETYRSTVLTFDHLGGWRMPQATSYFVLALPYNWWWFCLDSGMGTDIDQLQMQYFLHYITTLPDDASVVLACHDPNWINDALVNKPGTPHTQSRVSTVADALGDRMRMRLCGDIHNYTRYEYDGPATDQYKPLYVVSGGGGAFLHGTTNPGTSLPIYGVPHKRGGCYPPPKKRFAVSWILRFRLVNWKFDIVGSMLYCIVVAPLLPVTTFGADTHGDPEEALSWLGVVEFWTTIATLTARLLHGYFTESAVTLAIAVGLCAVTFLQTDGSLPTPKRLLYGLVHGLIHLVVAVTLLATLSTGFDRVVALGMTNSTETAWKPATVEVFKPAYYAVQPYCGSACAFLNDTFVEDAFVRTVGSLDVLEGTAYYHAVVTKLDGPFGVRVWAQYYFHVLWFYWLLAAPAVGFVIGLYMTFCVTFLGCSMEHAFAAFQIEDWKNFLRICIDPATRQLRVYVVGIQNVPRSWGRCPAHKEERADHPERKSHHMHSPSLWAPTSRHSKPQVVDEFVVTPRTSQSKPAPPETAGGGGRRNSVDGPEV
jgi:hypothetical protein